MKVPTLLQWFPRGMALFTILIWLGLFFFDYLKTIPAIFLVLAASLTTFISWKNEALGGCFFILLGSLYFVVAMGYQMGLLILGMVPLTLTGVCFLFSYFYGEHTEMQGSDF